MFPLIYENQDEPWSRARESVNGHKVLVHRPTRNVIQADRATDPDYGLIAEQLAQDGLPSPAQKDVDWLFESQEISEAAIQAVDALLPRRGDLCPDLCPRCVPTKRGNRRRPDSL